MSRDDNNDFSDKSGNEKIFNKGIADLQLLSMFERTCFFQRSSNNYKSWASTLQSWTNKLSADMSKDDLKQIDNDIITVKRMLLAPVRNYNIGDIENTLDGVERKLLKYQKDLGIDNPTKGGTFFDTDEDW